MVPFLYEMTNGIEDPEERDAALWGIFFASLMIAPLFTLIGVAMILGKTSKFVGLVKTIGKIHVYMTAILLSIILPIITEKGYDIAIMTAIITLIFSNLLVLIILLEIADPEDPELKAFLCLFVTGHGIILILMSLYFFIAYSS